MGKRIIPVFLVLILVLVISCSYRGGGSTVPSYDDTAAVEYDGNFACLGFWNVVIHEDGKVDLVDSRSTDLIVNVLQFLEPPPMTNLKVKFNTLVIDPINKVVEVDVVLTHPIPIPRYMGFDVRGVVFGPYVANADGFTIIPSPEFFTGVPFGYQDGILGTPDSVANFEGLAGYKYYCDGLGPDDDLVAFMFSGLGDKNRGRFSPGNSLTRHYVLEWGSTAYPFMVFNYAVYANYANPTGPPPIDIDDFPLTTSNSAEAFCANVFEFDNSLYFDTSSGTGGGSVSLMVDIWDWQGVVSNTTVESAEPGVMAPTLPDFWWSGEISYTVSYEFYDIPGSPTTTGDLDILVTAIDDVTFGDYWYAGLLDPGHPYYNENLYNCFIYTTTVAEG
jgi:hypothetical protein